MGIVVAETGGGQQVPAGVHGAVCSKIYDLGIQDGFEGKQQQKLVILWELDERKDDGKRFLISRTYTASLNEKAKLRQDLEAWRGRRFSPQELSGFDLDNIIGAPCQLAVVEYTKQNGMAGTKISAVMPLAKGMQAIKPELESDYVPDWVRRARGEDVPERGGFKDDIPFDTPDSEVTF
jgi:hypothetical protein